MSETLVRSWGPSQVKKANSQDLGLQQSHRSHKVLRLGIKDQPGIRQLQQSLEGLQSGLKGLKTSLYRFLGLPDNHQQSPVRSMDMP